MKVLHIKAPDMYRAGQMVGEDTRHDIQYVHAHLLSYLLTHGGYRNAGDISAIATRIMLQTRDRHPWSQRWLEGLAEGAGCGLGIISTIGYSEELMAFAGRPPEKCSTLVTKTNEGKGSEWVVAHTEDYEAHYLGLMYAMVLRVDGFPTTASLNYPGQLPNTAGTMSERGFCITNNSLVGPAKYGPSLQARHAAATLASTYAHAAEILLGEASPLTSHFTLLGSTSDQALSIEVSNFDAAYQAVNVAPIVAPFAHTNHALRVPLRAPEPAYPNSLERLELLKEACATDWKGEVPEGLLRFMGCGDNIIDRQPDPKDPTASVTLATLVIRPGTRDFWVRGRGPKDDLVHVTL